MNLRICFRRWRNAAAFLAPPGVLYRGDLKKRAITYDLLKITSNGHEDLFTARNEQPLQQFHQIIRYGGSATEAGDLIAGGQ
jgi:hypothetical protein